MNRKLLHHRLMIDSRVGRIVVLVVSVLGLFGYLWLSWTDLLLDSMEIPAKEKLSVRLGRAHISLYKLLKNPVLVSSILGEF